MSLTFSLRQSNSEALDLSQQTAQLLQKYAAMGTSIVPTPFISRPESTEVWLVYEKLLLSCLRTGDDKAAHLCLEKLTERFGPWNERVMGLRGLYQEAVASDNAALEKILKEYDKVLADDPGNTAVAKRRIALLRTLSRFNDAIVGLTELLDSSPTDIEAWGELSDVYLSQSLFAQAIFCLEEALLVAPNAWNIHARLGEVLFIVTASDNGISKNETLAEAIRRFCRSIELCDDYLRGYYGMKMATDQFLLSASTSNDDGALIGSTNNNGGLPVLPTTVARKLNERATSKLAELTRRPSDKSYAAGEIAAAKILLNNDAQARQR